MKIWLRDISEQPKDFRYTQADTWLKDLVKSHFEVEPYEAKRPSPEGLMTEVDVELNRLDEIFFVKGSLDCELTLLCSRCADGIQHPIKRKFQSLFTKSSELAGVTDDADGKHPERGHQFSASTWSQSHESGEDVEIELLEGDSIDLSSVIDQQIMLGTPLQPLCKEDCKGICPECGSNRNKGRCACSRLEKETPFKVLKDWNVNRKSGSDPR